ncbi:MAG: sensor histidine kinase [Ardenticatenaceae bacterium]|nr:sensor histidine kinase [Anaerolineales bacterium]MCB8937652.1 sensor histidine kinase [Ardenticatenaceae bacterium]MCB8974221.1 sensor histidine kinase [Ardenticatenaceae bacterium]
MKDDAKIIADLKQQIHELEQQLSDYQHLEKKLQWLATFPEQNPNMVIETDLLGRPTYMNPEARQRFPELWQKGSSHPLLKGLRPIVAAFVDTDQEFVGREVDMGDVVVEQKVCYTIEGDVYRLRIYAHDITARKRAEEAIQGLAKRIVQAQEEERHRISRELHDEAGQALTALKIALEIIQGDVPATEESLRQNLDEAIALTDSARDQIRMLARGLRPPALDTVGLNLTLEDFCQTFGRRTQLAIQYEGSSGLKLSGAVNICLYRVLQEALTNVAKHAQAEQVWVKLWQDETAVHLSIADDGLGFQKKGTAPLQSSGLGLLGMQERVELLNGRLELRTIPGEGTTVTANLPLRAAKGTL